jgi:hypothetical protein
MGRYETEKWELKNHYRKSEHNCSWCKHSVCTEKSIDEFSYECPKKEACGAGKKVKPSFDCDNWEHR